MTNYKARKMTDKTQWEEYLLSTKPETFLQSWNWGETNKLCGFDVVRYGIYTEDNLTGLIQLIKQPAKRGLHYLIPGGPVIDFENDELVNYVTFFLKNFAKVNKAWFIRTRPDKPDTPPLRAIMKKNGFVSAPMHLHGEHTLILNISQDEDQILKAMRKTTRHAIRKSLNEGHKISISKNPKDANIVYDLQKDTVKRHRFVGFGENLFVAQLKTFGADDQARLFICEDTNGTKLVAAIIIFYGDKVFYHHSGSLDIARKTNASYFTQWQIIKKAKEMGYKKYDFWGIAPTDDPKHRFAGVTIFKKGFGGYRTDWLQAHDLPTSPLYWLTYIFENVRRKARHL